MTKEFRLPTAKWKWFLGGFHIWRFHLQLYSLPLDKFVFHYSYQPPGFWTPIDDPKAQAALINDDDIGLKPMEQKHD